MEYFVKLDNTEKRRQIMQHLKVTPAALSMYFNFKRNSRRATKACIMALEAGGELKEVRTLNREEAMKILKRKGDVERIITSDK